MEAILRLMHENKITDYDLSENISIHHGIFSAYPQDDGWCFQADHPVELNGKSVTSGEIKPNSAILIDYDTKTAVLVMDKAFGKPMLVDLENGLTIGRKSDNKIELKTGLVSGHHCRFVQKNGEWIVEDLGSTNGTSVNDQLVQSAVLRSGDILKFGPYRLRFGKKLCVENADAKVYFHVSAKEEKIEDVFDARPYPWFSCAPRIYSELAPCHIRMESAPSIGDKPTMGMGGIALSPQLLALSLGMQALRYGLGRRKYSKKEKKRAEVYANYLASVEGKLQEHADLQRKHEEKYHPSTMSCMTRVFGPAPDLWERHPGDPDFLTLRLGTGTVPAKARVEIPALHLQLEEDELDHVPEQIAEKYATVDEIPVYTDLIRDGNCGLAGPRNCTVAMAQSMAVQIAALHSYDEVKIVVLFPEQEKELWSWMRWLPHCLSEDRDVRYIGCGRDAKKVLESMEPIIRQRMENKNQWNFGQQASKLPHYVFLVANPSILSHSEIGSALMENRPELGISGIFLGQSSSDFPHSVKNVVEVSGSPAQMTVHLATSNGRQTLITNECLVPDGEFERFARKMAPIRLTGGHNKKQNLPTNIGLFEGLRIRDIDKLDIDEWWENTATETSMAVPIGVKADGSLFYFNIHEKADGPHGLVAGGTGSGKSEMAKSWIASMALQFPPSEVNFVLIDFKGESLLQPFLELPHLAGSISNLDKDVARSFSAMESELDHRQRLLAEYECKDIIQYKKKRRYDRSMPEMPYIILIVDEFAELKKQFPDFTKPLEHIYQGGRSLGMLVVLMTQSPSGVVTDQMRSNAEFRWCLRVKSDLDSRELLGTTDASLLRLPGRAYVKSKENYELIQSFFGSKMYRKEKEKRPEDNCHVYAVGWNGERLEGQSTVKRKESGLEEINVLVKKIRDHCRRRQIPNAKQLWQKELDERIDVFSLEKQGKAWNNESAWTIKEPAKGPKAVLGLVDDPKHQCQYDLTHDFWKQGNLAVYGMPQSGKTTFLQTMIVSLCNRYTPEEVQLYLMDMKAFGLRSIESFPHVGVAGGYDEPEVMDKMVSMFQEELTRRKKLFRKLGAGSPQAYEEFTGQVLPTMILIVDDINQKKMAYTEFAESINLIAKEGVSYGIYLVCSFAGTSNISYQLAQDIHVKVALRLPERSSYNDIVGRLEVGQSLSDVMGRGYVRGEKGTLLFQTAIAHPEVNDSYRTMQLRDTGDQMNKSWKGMRPQGIVKVPEVLCFDELDGEPYLLGRNLDDGEVVRVNLEENQSLLISDGNVSAEDAEMGVKPPTDLLRNLIRQTGKIADAEFYVYSTRPKEFQDVTGNHKILTSIKELDESIPTLRTELQRRQGLWKKDPTVRFSPIVVVLDGLYECIKEAEKDTIGRLEVFIRLGKGLNFSVIAADTAKGVGKSRNEDSLLTATMRRGPVVLVGNTLAQHQVVDTYELRKKHPGPMGEEEACLVMSDADSVFFRWIHG